MRPPLTPSPAGEDDPRAPEHPSSPAATPPPRRHGPARAALLTSLTLVLAPLALVLGVLALHRQRRYGGPGRGVALAGIACATAVLVTAATVTVAQVAPSGYPAEEVPPVTAAAAPVQPTPPEGTGEEVPLTRLDVGDCFASPSRADHPDGTPWASVAVTSCDEPHHAEVFAVFDPEEVTDPARPTEPDGTAPHPGFAALDAAAARECGQAVAPYLVDDWTLGARGWQILHLPPDEEAWAAGERRTACLFATPDTATATGALAGDRADFDTDQLALLDSGAALDRLLWSEPDPATALPDRARWAAAVADGATEQAAGLRAHDWAEPAVAEAAADLAEVRDSAAAHWRDAAAADGDEDTFSAAHRAAYGLYGGTAERELRALLDLETDMP